MTATPRDPLRIHVEAGDAPPLAPSRLEEAVEATLRAEGVAEAEVSVTLVDDVSITELNRRWLGRDRPTDVLAFSLGGAGEPPLGDVYVGVEQARRQAAEHGVSVEEELVRLAVHGTLHVLGHDHPEGQERASSAMFRRQEELVRGLMQGEDTP